MFQIKNRLRYSAPGIATAKLFSSGSGKNPVVFLDIEADGEPLGRILIEVASLPALASVEDLVTHELSSFKKCNISICIILQLNADVVPKTAGT